MRRSLLEPPPLLEGGATIARYAAASPLWLFVLRDPGQRGFNVGKLAGGESLDPDSRSFGLFLGEFVTCHSVDPPRPRRTLAVEFLLLFVGHIRLLKNVWLSRTIHD